MVKTLQNKGLAVFVFLCVIFNFSCKQEVKQELIEEEEIPTGYYIEKYRPQYHFTPEEKWMNDPNGLVYKDSLYHLFYQYYPDSTIWGPMHWGHAVSKDMMVWKHKPIALFPDENGFIFSGSAVVDHNNTSGFGIKDNPAMVAIFTYHDMAGEKAGQNDFQTQGIAYSLDNGDSWTKYENNPVIENTGIKDFRDPKVFWNDKTEVWTMLLVAGDHLQIWNSPNLKEWKKVSEFGKDTGAHGGVWECPDLFPLKIEGTDEVKWVLLISINPGAPNGGSGTQYFIGDFDGTTFTTDQVEHKWIDLGRDNYAGVTYNDTPNNERIFIGWMSNWDYARETPTEKWRSAMTVPRALTLRKVGDEVSLFNYPVIGFEKHVALAYPESIIKIQPTRKRIIPLKYGNQSKTKFTLSVPNTQMYFRNKNGDSLSIDIDRDKKVVTLDRRKSGNVDFSDKFSPGVQQMKIPSLPDGLIEIVFLLDHSSLELFINGGQYVMTNQIFPNEFFRAITIVNNSEEELVIEDFTEHKVERVWD
ncbi:glycoside hydrolase family 32 protein [Maribacter sp. 1_MG-2023]|uniref:glycoside hydrolase family 32 protein n=1 Tax=Maribacter sp. 1_MG-2023 TaxID=3062677 RepID=UPI0026E1E169|nr:glycoside hydrolase family 32 protein [Maribacter sp. 1_MG-2023]MDO6473115.1 glycoside hydrolase family 32 protein [Maribacter sp. 1_MG-2023]